MFMYRQMVDSSYGYWPSINERYTEVLTGLTSSFSLLVIEHVSSKSACTLYMYKSRSEGGGSAISISTHVWLGFSGTYHKHWKTLKNGVADHEIIAHLFLYIN